MSRSETERNTGKNKSGASALVDARAFVSLLVAAGPGLWASSQVGVTPALPLVGYIVAVVSIPLCLLVGLNYGIELAIGALRQFRRLRTEWRRTFSGRH